MEVKVEKDIVYRDGRRVIRFKHRGAKFTISEDPPEWGNTGMVSVDVKEQ